MIGRLLSRYRYINFVISLSIAKIEKKNINFIRIKIFFSEKIHVHVFYFAKKNKTKNKTQESAYVILLFI